MSATTSSRALTLEPALGALAAGEVVVLCDRERDRADLIAAAELTGADAVALMARVGCGVIAVALPRRRCKELGLQAQPGVGMRPTVDSDRQLPLASVEAREGVTTGISAADRATTILTLARARRQDSLVVPGHVFPVPAADGGLLEHRGRAEAAVDAVVLAGAGRAATICDLLDDDGALAGVDFGASTAARYGLQTLEAAHLAELRFESQWFGVLNTKEER